MKFQKRQWSVVGSLIIAACSFPLLLLGPAAHIAYLFEAPIGSLLKRMGFRAGNLFDLGVAFLAFCIALIVAAIMSFFIYLGCRWTNIRDEPRCPKCKSELSGNVLPSCPECGEALVPKQSDAGIMPKPSIPAGRVDEKDPIVDNRQE